MQLTLAVERKEEKREEGYKGLHTFPELRGDVRSHWSKQLTQGLERRLVGVASLQLSSVSECVAKDHQFRDCHVECVSIPERQCHLQTHTHSLNLSPSPSLSHTHAHTHSLSLSHTHGPAVWLCV